VTPAEAPAEAPAKAPVVTARAARVLPELPFRTERWNSVDAEVSLKAASIHGAGALPLQDLVTHLSLRDSVLRLDPLDFAIADGRLAAVIVLDGRREPIKAQARVRVRRVAMARIFPGFAPGQGEFGRLGGEFDLVGQGNSVRSMLATADGKLGLVITGGSVSRLMMERVGLHLWEVLALQLSGDQSIKLRCAVGDFAVSGGLMRSNALIFDTAVTTIVGSGTIDLGEERLDLTLRQKTKNTSPLALRSPIHIGGTLARPVAEVDKGRVAMRAFGALALGIVNPLLTLIPLIDAGPGQDSDCRQLVRDARARSRTTSSDATAGD
jgi:AsmA protein